MCERREDVTMSKDHGPGHRPVRLWGFNLKTWHMLIVTAAAILSIFAAAITSGAYVGNVVLDREWDNRMDRFHDVAIPEITGLIRTEVKLAVDHHEAEALAEYNADKVALAGRLSGLETHATDTDARLQRIEDMLWALYSLRFGNTPPPRSPNGH